jgi:hypothetical protein
MIIFGLGARGAHVAERLVTPMRGAVVCGRARGGPHDLACAASCWGGSSGRLKGPAMRRNDASGAKRPPDYDGLMIDLDGVVCLGGRPIDGAVEAVTVLRKRGARLLFLPTTRRGRAPSSPRACRAIGIPASEADVPPRRARHRLACA